jgi:serine phosphatase RsbU (regulator of sigma subunit)/ketosteroid isomerase-like protein
MSLRSMQRTLVGWHHAGCQAVGESRVGSEEDALLSSEEEKNMALVHRFLEAQANADLDTLEELLAPDFVDHSLLPGQEPSREGYMQQVAEQIAALSEVRCIIEDQLAKGEKVVSRITWRSIHDRGEYFGLMPRDKEVVVTSMAMHRIEGGKIAEEWGEGSGGALEVAQARLEQEVLKRERVEQELRVARSIQQASLPKEVPELEGWQISPYYQPAREVGGDFYDFHLLSEGRLGMVVGDATSKGVPAALVMSTTLGMLQLAALALACSSPGEVLERVNEALFTRIPANMFVSCFYAILEPGSGRLTYANAGHDLPYLHRNGYAEELRARGMPLGLMSKMRYEEKETIVHSGQAALLYSDGLVEAHDPEGDMFGFPRLRTLIAERAEEERPLGEVLLEELYSFVGEGWEQEDDITLLTLKRSA